MHDHHPGPDVGGHLGEAYTRTRTSPSSPRSWASSTTSSAEHNRPRRFRTEASGKRCCRHLDQLRPRWYACRRWPASTRPSGTPRQGARPAPVAALGRLPRPYPHDRIGGTTSRRRELEGQEIEREIDFFQQEHGMVGEVQDRRERRRSTRAPCRARRHAGDEFLFVVDANQGYTVPRRWPSSRSSGPRHQYRWFEEPTRWHADFRGLRDVRMRGNVDVAAARARSAGLGCAR